MECRGWAGLSRSTTAPSHHRPNIAPHVSQCGSSAVCGGCHLGLASSEIWSQEANLRDNQSFPSWHMCASRSRGTIYHLSCKEASPCLRSSHLPLGKCQHGAFFWESVKQVRAKYFQPNIWKSIFSWIPMKWHWAIAYCSDPCTLIGQCIAKNGL